VAHNHGEPASSRLLRTNIPVRLCCLLPPLDTRKDLPWTHFAALFCLANRRTTALSTALA
jgi:hypothetical protein